jgi:hypothetical protein
MARYTVTAPTAWNADLAFAWMADLRHLSDWDPGIVSSTQVAGDGPSVGAEYDVVVEVAGREQTMRYVIRELDVADRRLLAESETAVLTSYDRISVDAAGGGAEVTYDADLVMKGVAKVADPLVGVGFDRMGDTAADGLRRVLSLPAPP